MDRDKQGKRERQVDKRRNRRREKKKGILTRVHIRRMGWSPSTKETDSERRARETASKRSPFDFLGQQN